MVFIFAYVAFAGLSHVNNRCEARDTEITVRARVNKRIIAGSHVLLSIVQCLINEYSP
jgi:uncharacterized membrane protein